ncbi:GPO family capsid scaffolding protein [Salmonella enterica subsp. enterica]|nr:GPO family capsid scaffolding protein [Salmonella enterica subsp. enterica]EEG5547107.1 GPO family capsid scaffolding protein [Salmonella enterica subsp. enterica]
MSTLIKNVPIAKVGKIFDGREITRHIIERCVANFNPEIYQPRVTLRTAYDIKGDVVALRIEDDTLRADIKTPVSPGTVKNWNVYPAIEYLPVGEPGYPALTGVLLSEEKTAKTPSLLKTATSVRAINLYRCNH